MDDLLKFATEYYNSVIQEIPFDDISIYKGGLRKHSFVYLKPFFERSNGDFPDTLDPVRLSVFENEPEKIVVQDGRHRLLLSKAFGIKRVPGVLRSVDESGDEVERNVNIVM